MDDDTTVTAHGPKPRLGARLYAALKSRMRWRSKVADLRKIVKSRDIELRDVRDSREKWKNDAREARRRICELEEEAAQLREQSAALKKKQVNQMFRKSSRLLTQPGASTAS